MQGKMRLIISVALRLMLALLLPLRITVSIGVTTNQFSASGMIWSLSNDVFQWDYFTLIAGIVCSIPAIAYCIYFKNIVRDSHSVKAAIITSLLLLALPLVGLYLPEVIGWLFYIPSGFPVLLIFGFILIPALHQLLSSSGIRVISAEYLLLLTCLVAILVCPFVILYNNGLYAQDRTLTSSGFMTFSWVRSGWSDEAGLTFFGPSSVTELESMLSSFQVMILLRLVLLSFIALYLSMRITIVGALLSGLFEELVLLVIAFNVNSTIIAQPYYSTGAVPFPYLFPLLMLLLAIHWKLKRDVPLDVEDDEEYIAIPFTLRFKQWISDFKRRFHSHKDISGSETT